jgi:hypothetical protein
MESKMSDVKKKKDRSAIKLVNSILVVIIIILASAFIINIFHPLNPQKEINYCMPIGMLTSTNFSAPSGNLTNNNSGWIINVLVYDGCVLDYKKIEIEIRSHNGNVLLEQNTAPSKALFVDSNINDPIGSAWYLFGDKDPYFNHKGKRTLLDKNNIQLLNESEIKTLENVRFVIVEKHQDKKHIIDPGDRVFIFKDNNGDGIKEIPSSSSIGFIWAGNRFSSAALE